MTAYESKLSILKLVYPALSSQEAYWQAKTKDKDVESQLRKSDFYMIGARSEGKFLNLKVDTQNELITFNFVIAGKFSDSVIISIRQLPAVAEKPDVQWQLEAGEKILRVWLVDEQECRTELLEWFTTEKLLFDKSRGRAGISGFLRYREAYTYDLLYVGIAKVGDSFDRLIANGHKARGDILQNEEQRQTGARVADEIYLFFFRVIPNFIKTFDVGHDFADEDFTTEVEQKQVVADAEKAFVSLLDPQYNEVKYRSYPKGADGLYSTQLDRYGYAIGENITLIASNGSFRGGWDSDQAFISNDGDCIFVEGDQVKHYCSGIDY